MKGFIQQEWGNIEKRDSNVEFLRLLCMLLILVHHIICHGCFSIDKILMANGNLTIIDSYAIIINSFCFVGVNCFILISGYYGIKPKVKGFLNMYIFCVFYSMLLMENISLLDILKLFFYPVGRWWFMKCYFILYLISPIINKGLNNSSDKEYNIILLLFSFVNLYAGYFFNIYANNGFSVGHMVYIYIIGHGIFRYRKYIPGRIPFPLYIFSCLGFGFISIISHYYSLPYWKAMSYNNPLMILGAIGLFLYITSFHFNRKWINFIAKSSLAIYLFQNLNDFRILGDKFWQYINLKSFDNFQTIGMLTIYIIAFSFIFMTITIITDQFRKVFSYILLNKCGSLIKCQKTLFK